jgi:hypothetical protein
VTFAGFPPQRTLPSDSTAAMSSSQPFLAAPTDAARVSPPADHALRAAGVDA